MAFLNKSDSFFLPYLHYDAVKICDLIPEEWANDKLDHDQLYIEPDLRLPLYDDTQDMLVSGLDMGIWNELDLDAFYDDKYLKRNQEYSSSESEDEDDEDEIADADESKEPSQSP